MHSKGFSLVELVILLTILGLMALFAVPNYLNSMMQSRRHDGQSALLDLVNRLEQHYAQHQTYQSATLGTGAKTDIKSGPLSPEKWYILSIPLQTDTTFFIQATPRGMQAKDATCQALTLDHLGTKGSIPAHHAAQCWS